MRGKFGLVLLVAFMAMLFGTNLLAQSYNQLTGQKIPGAVQLHNNKSSFGVAFFGQPLSIEKKEIDNLWADIKAKVPVEKEQIKQMGRDILLTGEDWLNKTSDWFKGIAGLKGRDGSKENADLI